jgi:hypothetical protein
MNEFLIIVIVLSAYFMPVIVAAIRGHKNGMAILMVNLFLVSKPKSKLFAYCVWL